MKKILTMLLVAFTFASCETGKGTTQKEITVIGGQTEITLNPDQTEINNGEGIKFTTTGSWHAEVKEVTTAKAENTVGWITLSQTSGDKAGDYTVKVTLKQNDTGQDRSAEISIVCGDTTITITVTQRGIATENEDNIQLADGTKEYTAEAEQTTIKDGKGIKFITTGAWIAKAEEVTDTEGEAKTAEWVTLEPNSGDKAGEYTMSVTLTANDTELERKAVIRIKCGEAEETVTISQNGIEGPAQDVGIVKDITYSCAYWSEDPYKDGKQTHEFKYDDKDRITEYVIKIYDENEEDLSTLTTRLTYTASGNIQIKEDLDGTVLANYTMEMSGKYAKTINMFKNDQTKATKYDFAYTDNRLTRISWLSYDSKYSNVYAYQNGVLASIIYEGTYRDVTGLDSYFGTVRNNTLNIDPNALFMYLDLGYTGYSSINDDQYTGIYGYEFTGRLERLAMMRLIGKGSDYYIDKIENYDAVEEIDYIFTEPNIVIPQSEIYYDYQYDNVLEYKFTDGYVSSITTKVTVKKMQKDFEIVVGNELRNPDEPRDGYFYEIQNRKDTELSQGTNVYTYAFTYVR